MSFFYFSFPIEKFNSGQRLFSTNCEVCHPNGNNLILPEKNLKKQSLETNGMNSKFAIVYQVRNGKNGMPAFGDQIDQKDLERIAEYLLFQSESNFENK